MEKEARPGGSEAGKPQPGVRSAFEAEPGATEPDVASGSDLAGGPDTAADAEFRRLHPRWVTLRRLGILARTVFFAVGAFFAELFIALPLPAGTLPIAVAVAGLALVAFWPPVQHRAWGFRVRADDLFVQRGVVWRAASIIPHSRIQHVDTQSGPLERALGLAHVVIYTAGVRGADVTIPGLAQEEAEALRDLLAHLGGLHDGV